MSTPTSLPFAIPTSLSIGLISYHPWMMLVPFGIFLIIYVSLSSVLYYHWIKYGMGDRGIHIAELTFGIGTAALLFVAFVGLGNI